MGRERRIGDGHGESRLLRSERGVVKQMNQTRKMRWGERRVDITMADRVQLLIMTVQRMGT